MAKQRMTRKLNDENTATTFDVDSGKATLVCTHSDIPTDLVPYFIHQGLNKIIGDYVSGNTKDGTPKAIIDKMTALWDKIKAGEVTMRGDGSGVSMSESRQDLIAAIASVKDYSIDDTRDKLTALLTAAVVEGDKDATRKARKKITDDLAANKDVALAILKIVEARAKKTAKELTAMADTSAPLSI